MASRRRVAADGTAGKPRLAKVTSMSWGVITNLRTEPRAVGIFSSCSRPVRAVAAMDGRCGDDERDYIGRCSPTPTALTRTGS
jgi:hypothetical protein